MLTERDRAVLDIAAKHFRHQASREVEIRVKLDLPWTQYNQILNQLIDRP